MDERLSVRIGRGNGAFSIRASSHCISRRTRPGRFIVMVHQMVRDLQGNVLLDTIVHHAYHIRDGLIERMDIE